MGARASLRSSGTVSTQVKLRYQKTNGDYDCKMITSKAKVNTIVANETLDQNLTVPCWLLGLEILQVILRAKALNLSVIYTVIWLGGSYWSKDTVLPGLEQRKGVLHKRMRRGW